MPPADAQRWEVWSTSGPDDGLLVKANNGPWVRFTDYAALREEVERLQRERDAGIALEEQYLEENFEMRRERDAARAALAASDRALLLALDLHCPGYTHDTEGCPRCELLASPAIASARARAQEAGK